ncbi:MAG TPA: hypothetical protein VFV41_10890 [Streptosporangiaceae bacterium]|nr:hypothetical protein [Streptosporangiaceae bacterium]
MSDTHTPSQPAPAHGADAAPPRGPVPAPPALLAVQASLDQRDNGGDGAAELAR